MSEKRKREDVEATPFECVILTMIPEDAINTKFYVTSFDNWKTFGVPFHAVHKDVGFLGKVHYLDTNVLKEEKDYCRDKTYWRKIDKDELIFYQMEYTCMILVHPFEYPEPEQIIKAMSK